MQRSYLVTLTPRYAFFLLMALALLALTFIPHHLAARPQSQETGENGTSSSALCFFLPLVQGNGDAASATTITPLQPNSYNALSGETPTAQGEITAGTCETYIQLGPYNLIVNNGQITLVTASGDANISGIEIYRR